MAARPPPDPASCSHSLGTGTCYLYVAPCVYEDYLKLGFSRDPLQRLESLHPRFFEFFDIDRAFLVETETVRDARDLELALGRPIEAHNAPAPLVVRREAAGHTEWYRGAYDGLLSRAGELESEGYMLHRPLRPWLRQRLLQRSDRLYAWASTVWAQMEQGPPLDEPVLRMLRRHLRDVLDAYPALDIELEPLLPQEVSQWYRAS